MLPAKVLAIEAQVWLLDPGIRAARLNLALNRAANARTTNATSGSVDQGAQQSGYTVLASTAEP